MVSAMRRSRLVSGVAATVAVGVVVSTQWVSGAGESDESVFVPTTPCRLVDTRSGADNVGPRSTPVGADQEAEFNAHDGSDSGSTCVIPSTATAISANVVAVGPTANGFVATYPGDEPNPGTATLNFVAGQAPTPNAAIIPLAADGSFNVFNKFGSVNLVIDVNGFYQPSSNVGATGPQGPAGPAGSDGATGAQGPAGPVNRISDEQIAVLAWYEDPGAAATIAVGTSPSGVAYDGTNIYVTNFNSASVSVINPTTNTVTTTIAVGTRPFGVAYDGTNIYVTNNGSNSVSVINPATNTVTTTIGVGSLPYGVAYDGTNIWVANTGSNSVSKLIPR